MAVNTESAMTRRTILSLKIVMVALVIAGAVNAQQIKNAVPDVARPLPLSAVRLTAGPLKRAQDLDAEYLLKLEPVMAEIIRRAKERAGI